MIKFNALEYKVSREERKKIKRLILISRYYINEGIKKEKATQIAFHNEKNLTQKIIKIVLIGLGA